MTTSGWSFEEPCRRIVLTGGPGAGKTAVLELARLHVCEHVAILPEAASMLFVGGFPRGPELDSLRAAQRAIYHVQHELELATEARGRGKLCALLCDRGTVDGAAYWPGPDTLWSMVGTTHEAEIGRYYAAVHLRVPGDHGYNRDNPVRVESALEAARIDSRIAEEWAAHPRRVEIANHTHFVVKAYRTLAVLFDQLPDCCPHAARVRAGLMQSKWTLDPRT